MVYDASDEGLFGVVLYNGHPFPGSGYLDERSNPWAAYEGIDYDPLPIHCEDYFKPPLWLRLWVIAMTFFTSPRLPRQYETSHTKLHIAAPHIELWGGFGATSARVHPAQLGVIA
jgi:hypothetical protein